MENKDVGFTTFLFSVIPTSLYYHLQLCRGNAPQPQPEKEFWELLGTLYEVHVAFKKCIPYAPSADEICREIEDFILELQRNYTLPQQFDMEKLTEQGAV